MEVKGVTAVDLYSLVSSNDPEYKSLLKELDVVFMQGWIRTNRDNGSIGFIALNDGTCEYIQVKIFNLSMTTQLKIMMFCHI